MIPEPHGPPGVPATPGPADRAPPRRRRRLPPLDPSAILAKDAAIWGRRRSIYLLRSGSLLAMILVGALMLWGALVSRGGGTVEEAQQAAAVSRLLLIAAAWFQFGVLPIVTAVLVAPSLCEQRLKGTLGALLTTPLSAWQIALGTLAAPLLQILVLAILPTPVLIAISVFGGIPAWFAVGSAGLTGATVVLAACAGVLCSLLSRRPASATANAIGLTGFFVLGVPLIAGILNLQGWPIPWRAVATASTGMAMVTLTDEATGGSSGPAELLRLGLSSAAAAVAAGLVMFVLAVCVLRRSLRDESIWTGPTPARAPTPGPRPRTPATVRRSGVVWDFPVLWREWRHPMIRSRLARRITWPALALAALYLGVSVDESSVEIAIPIAMLGAMATLFIAASAGTNAFAMEREARTLETLLATPLSASALVWSKFAAALKRLLFVPGAAAVLITAANAGAGVGSWAGGAVAMLGLGPAAMIIAATGVLLGVIGRKASSAAAGNVGVWVAFYGLLPILVITFVNLSDARWLEPILERLAVAHPAATVVVGLQFGIQRHGRVHLPGGEPVTLPEWLGIMASLWAVHAVIAALILWMAARLLARRTSRRV